jgi:penicillin-binding protein 1A
LKIEYLKTIYRKFHKNSLKYSKTEILEMYLNTIYLSQRTNGVKAAAEEYFGKELKDLTLVECAALASIPKSPTKYDTLRNPGHNRDRRNLVLKLMMEEGYITQAQFEEAKETPLVLKSDSNDDYEETVHSYYIDAVMDQVVADLMEQYGYDRSTATRMLFSGGLHIVTTLDPDVQNALETVFEDDSNKYLFLKNEQEDVVGGVKPQAAMVIMNPENGDVLGLVGGRGTKKESRGFNRATQGLRQCGSSIKPLTIYSLALEKGLITFGSAIDDVPSMQIDDKYWPGNTPSGFKGLVSVNYAVMKSLNTIPVKLVNQMSAEECFKFLTETLGFTSPIAKEIISGTTFSDIAVSPMALGSFTHGVTTLEMCSGYCMFANGGESYSPRFYTEVKNSRGDIILSDRTNRVKNALSPQNAFIMTSIMKNVVSSSAGTGYRVTLDNEYDVEVAAKTGSTNDDRDRYFVAYTPEYVGACWFGYDNNKALTCYSVNPALSLWDNVMKIIYRGKTERGEEYQKKFDIPSGIIKVKYCTVSGKLVGDACEKDLYCEISNSSCVEEGYFALGTQPTEVCDKHVLVDWDVDTKAICFDGCTCQNTKKVALRQNYRAFESYVSVTDTQYLYYPIPDDYVFPENKNLPFYANHPDYEGVKYFGLSTSIKAPYNRICIEHYNPSTPDIPDVPDTPDIPNEPAIPVEDNQ